MSSCCHLALSVNGRLPGSHPGNSGSIPDRATSAVMAERKTRCVQTAVSARACRFESY